MIAARACGWRASLVGARGNLMWDGVLRGSGALAGAGILTAIFGTPAAVGLVGFVVVTIWVNGPLGMFMPATYEPILMLFGRLYPPVVIALTGILGTVYVEFLNYHLYARVFRASPLAPIRENPVVERLVPLFRRAPFFTVWLCSWSPLPYWAVRILAPLAGYSVRRYLIATFVGRFPRLWFFAALGALPIPNGVLIPIILVAVALALVLVFAKPVGARLRGLVRRVGFRNVPRPVPASSSGEVPCGS